MVGTTKDPDKTGIVLGLSIFDFRSIPATMTEDIFSKTGRLAPRIGFEDRSIPVYPARQVADLHWPIQVMISLPSSKVGTVPALT